MDQKQNRFPMWELVQLGVLLRDLASVTAEDSISGVPHENGSIPDRLQDLLDSLERFELVRSAGKIREQIESLIDDMRRTLHELPAAQLGDRAADLIAIATDLEGEMRDEALKRSVFVVPKDDGFAEDLLQDPRVQFRVDLAHPPAPPEHAIRDLQEAAECYAIGRPAAAIVFSLRATEAFLRTFYEEVIRAQPDEEATWGALLHTIQLPVVGCSHSIPSQLGTLKKRRNKTMHAGKRDPEEWNDQAAREIMGRCGKAIEAMWKHLAKLQREPREGRRGSQKGQAIAP